MEYGVVLPTLAMFGEELPDQRGLINYARAAFQAGFRSAWAAHHIMHQDPGYYAPVCLQAVATAVPGLKVGLGTMPAFLQHPLYAAKAIATLERLTDGRLELAFSIGDERPEMIALGVDPSERGGRLDELLEVLDRLRKEDRVTHDGRFYQFENGRILPALARAGTPTYIASWSGTQALQRIFRYGAGWMASGLFSTRANLTQGMAALRDAATKRDVAIPPTIITNVLTCISEDDSMLERARRAVSDPTGSLSGALGVRLIGNAASARGQIDFLRGLGFDRLNVLPVNYEASQLEVFMRIVQP